MVQSQQRLGHAQLVVEVFLRLVGIEPGGQHRGDHFLGGRLADAAGNAHDGNVKAGTVPCGQRTHRPQRGIHLHAGLFIFRRLSLGQATGRALFNTAGHEAVTVNPRADKRHEQRAGRRLTAVAGHEGNFLLQRTLRAKILAARSLYELANGKVLHRLPSSARSTSFWQSVS